MVLPGETCWGVLTTYNVDESRKKDDDDGENAHQGTVQSGLDYPSGESLQSGWEKLDEGVKRTEK